MAVAVVVKGRSIIKRLRYRRRFVRAKSSVPYIYPMCTRPNRPSGPRDGLPEAGRHIKIIDLPFFSNSIKDKLSFDGWLI